ncbi:nitrate reductase molybdenum cofactor assembly chaperone [Paucibacter sp. PLA-PC-4]|uniref:nitrate reductase molybdenum cofactor assembly chaperone n=1 Tax=Paucibacter sp. PLA-PC-4 TaxID=2993655 RepID=UPI00224ABAF3|nr:nitrate reductase molybdenum cofactor assembly chaperone [Paucibacter sp. PLA-PC-4]MCX2865400.1 nitrate reductase molybdenum cofactor assembly chaperone [Paucibacter sp. PLA-PC-4]
MNKDKTPMSRSCRVLARMLDYPHAEMRAALPELYAVLRDEAALSAERLDELKALMGTLQQGNAYTVEGRYVDSFDRGRATSLHLFEHVHGDSRDRGPALVDLAQTYEAGGMFFDASELPDYLPVVLEFASTQPSATARAFLGEMAHILNTIHSGLIKHENPYAAAIGAVLELAGEKPQAVQISADEPLDEAWVEPPAFDGCSSKGQSRPGAPQPIHIVKNTPMNQGVRP